MQLQRFVLSRVGGTACIAVCVNVYIGIQLFSSHNSKCWVFNFKVFEGLGLDYLKDYILLHEPTDVSWGCPFLGTSPEEVQWLAVSKLSFSVVAPNLENSLFRKVYISSFSPCFPMPM